MLEIFALSSLVSNIRKTLIDKNRKPGWFVALAIILWFHFEITGFIISYALGLEFPANSLFLVTGGAGFIAGCEISKTRHLFNAKQTHR